MEQEAGLVKPPSIERSFRVTRSRNYKVLPRSDGRFGSLLLEPSTPTSATCESKTGNNCSPDTQTTASSEGDGDGLYGPPATRRSQPNVTQTTRSSETRRRKRKPGSTYRTSTSQLISYEAEGRTAENDIPFDQAASDAAARDSATSTAVFAVDNQRDHQHVYSPIQALHLSDFDDSKLSPVTTSRFESIWLSSPEGSPDPSMFTKSSSAAVLVAPKAIPAISKYPITQEHLGELVREMDESNTRFTFPTPRYSDPEPWSEIQLPSTSITSDLSSHTSTALEPLHILSARPATHEMEETLLWQPTHKSHSALGRTSAIHPYENYKAAFTATGRAEQPRYDMQQQMAHIARPQPPVIRGDAHTSSRTGTPPNQFSVSSKDEDTLFDFGDGDEQTNVVILHDDAGMKNNIKVTHKIRRRTRQRRGTVPLGTDDDTSVENYGASTVPATSLQERTHQAWKSRQRKNSNLRSTKPDPSRPKKGSSQSVSFGKSNTVHHFEPSAQEIYDRQNRGDEEDASWDRSLNSEYTKTLESEVEDMIKDILFIGSADKSKPGRRKYKDKPQVRRKLRQIQMAATMKDETPTVTDTDTLEDKLFEDTSTLPSTVEAVPPEQVMAVVVDRRTPTRASKQGEKLTPIERPLNDSVYSSESLLSFQAHTRSTIQSHDRSSARSVSSADSHTIESLPTYETEKNGDDNPFAALVGFMEGGLSAMTSVMGYAFSEGRDSLNKLQQPSRGLQTKRDIEEVPSKAESTNGFSIFERCMGSGPFLVRTCEISQSETVIPAEVVDKLTQDMMWHNPTIVKSTSGSPYYPHDNEIMDDEKQEEEEIDMQLETLASGSKVSQLAIHAAHSVHKLQGVEYDESVPIDLGKEVQVCPVKLKLPLGIIFLENDGGCFVTSISPDGSAALCGGVEVGDQLACINGASSLRMKVDDICHVIANSSDPSEVELVFLRYIGPFRAAKNTRTAKKSLIVEAENIHDSYVHAKSNLDSKEEKPLPRKNHPINSNSKKEPPKVEQEEEKPLKKKGGFRLFGRGRKNKDKINGEQTR